MLMKCEEVAWVCEDDGLMRVSEVLLCKFLRIKADLVQYE
jgi:hypothetical protein